MRGAPSRSVGRMSLTWNLSKIPDLTGRVAVVTGANGGLGLESARALAGAGAHVVMAARNQEKAAAARVDVLASHPGASLEVVPLDLGSLASVSEAAGVIAGAHDRIDVLMLNAGVMAMPGSTADGFDLQLGTNVLGHWALLSHLLPTVLRTPRARVVTLSSIAQHQGRALDPADPHLRAKADPWLMYGSTKLAMRHLAVGLQQQLDEAGSDVLAVVAHPGLTNSDLQTTTHHAGGAGFQGPLYDTLSDWIGMSVPYGALSQVRAATDPGVRGGTLYGPAFALAGPPVRRPLVRPGTEEAVRRLWQVCEQETGLRVDVASARV